MHIEKEMIKETIGKYYIFILGMCMIIFSCKENKNLPAKLESKTKSHLIKNDFKYEFDFPDTILVNKPYDGKIYFESPLDTVTEKFFDKKKYRYVVFKLPKDNRYNSDKELYDDSSMEYRFGATDNKTISFYDITFNKTGTFQIKGILEDIIIISDSVDKDKKRMIELSGEISHKIVVLEK